MKINQHIDCLACDNTHDIDTILTFKAHNMLNFIEINSIKAASACVIWLHGLGANGHDFVPVAQMLNMPHVHFILPHAEPLAVTVNHGYEMPAWYDVLSLEPGNPEDLTGIRKSQQNINDLIAQVIKQGIPANRIALAGFSQGGAIALQTALRYPEKLAGVLALSTYVPVKDTLMAERSSANQQTPIFMAHGKFDDVIKMTTAEQSKTFLTAQGYTVEWHAYDMAHNVNEAEIDDIKQFLTRILPAND